MGRPKGTIISVEQRRKTSLVLTGRRLSEENKKNIGLANKWKVRSPEIKKSMSDRMKGNIPWSKGKKFTQEHRKALSDSHMGNPSSRKMFQGNKNEYHKLHAWLSRNKDKGNICEFCSGYFEGYRIQFANKSGEYKKDLDDWLILCSKCHVKYDFQLVKNKEKENVY